MLYGQLAQLHPEHDPVLMRRLRLLSRAGYAMQECAAEFVERMPGEPEANYLHRLRYAAPAGYLSQIIDYLAGTLFSVPVRVQAEPPSSVPDLWEAVLEDADRAGRELSAIVQGAVGTSLLLRYSWLTTDYPAPVEVQTLAAERAVGGGRPYVYETDPECVLDWSCDASGRLLWLVRRDRIADRPTPADVRGSYRDEFVVWTMSGTAQWERWASKVYKPGEQPDARDPLVLVGGGVTSFLAIPYVRLELPDGLWVGGKIGPLIEEHYRRRADLVGGLARSLTEIPVLKRGAEIPAVHGRVSDTQSNPARGRDVIERGSLGKVVALGADDSFAFVGPSGVAYQLAADEIARTREEIFRTVNAMALTVSASAGRSAQTAESKREDRAATESVLRYIGRLTREAVERILTIASDGRGEYLAWSAEGLDEYSLHDYEQAIGEAERVKQLAIPSRTFRSLYLTTTALDLVPYADTPTREAIRAEIEEGVSDDMEHQHAETALLREFANGDTERPGPRGRADSSRDDDAGDGGGGAADAPVAEGA